VCDGKIMLFALAFDSHLKYLHDFCMSLNTCVAERALSTALHQITDLPVRVLLSGFVKFVSSIRIGKAALKIGWKNRRSDERSDGRRDERMEGTIIRG
jgi:hypothetical protein